MEKNYSFEDRRANRPARESLAPAGLFFLGSTELETHGRGCAVCGAGGLGLDLSALARGLATSPAWGEMPGAVLVVRRTPRPVLGVIGRFDAAAEARLEVLGPQLAKGLDCLRYVDYSQAQDDCERLAGLLIERFGREELRRFRFVGIPRGGLIVLGMLSYVLGLERTQLEGPHPPDAPLVVVDDCAFSGFRFDEFLARCESRRIAFAHLYSHPELRAAVEARQPRVVACLGAQDLHDHAPARHGAQYPAWREGWADRLGADSGYWIGQPEHLCFPWSEPDVTVWNPTTERSERGWRLVPPELCVKTRWTLGTQPVSVQVQPEGTGFLRPSERVLYGEIDGSIVVGNTEAKTSFVLTGVAADMWGAVVEHGNLEGAAASLSEMYDAHHAVLYADLRDYTEDLLARDLLERSDDHTIGR